MGAFLQIINQVFEIQEKMKGEPISEKLERNFNRLHHLFEEEGYGLINPLGEKYSESRTDCEASIVGNQSKNLVITQVIKPVIYHTQNGQRTVVQKGIVIVESK